ncbi:max dimerization protein 1 isoform X3 [Indicator indicator]|uniref:max dimerization protein 1 isoform X3 n=1 Tax=Indicator indicator TaxID=1002788 RepID=UPI0023DFF2A9|nr:max dimerization protein 1 isoform X3 [Indicator indicator]
MAADAGLSIQLLLEAAEFLERREREAEHGYASLLPGKDGEALRRRVKARKSGGGSRRAHLRLCLEKLKVQVPLGGASSKHTTLSLLTKAKLHIKKLEDYDRRAVHQKEQLLREQRHLRRQLEKLGVERLRTDSIGSSLCSERSDSEREEMEVDVESTDDLPADLDWSSSSSSSSPSDSDERGSLPSVCSDEGYSSSSLERLKLQSNHKPPLGL